MEATIEKLDLQKADPNYYKVGKEPKVVDLDPYYYLIVQGKGSPESEHVWKAVEKLYAVAYSIKFNCKAEDMDFVVPKMEGFWWIDGGFYEQHKMPETPKDKWNWKFMIRMPDFVEEDHFYRAIQKVKLKNPKLIQNDEVSFELLNEGRCIQILHLGSYHNEEANVSRIMEYAQNKGLTINGYHHEIYLSDPRRTPEHKLKTIIRYQIK